MVNNSGLQSVPPIPLPHPHINGASIPTMPFGGIPFSHLGPNGMPPYRTMYPAYSLYSPYGMHPSAYGLPHTVPTSPVSPRTMATSADLRRDSSPLVLSKPVRSVTPNSSNSNSSNLPPPHQPSPLSLTSSSSSQPPQSLSNLRDQPSTHPHQPSPLSHQSASRTHSPRGQSPSRERDSYR